VFVIITVMAIGTKLLQGDPDRGCTACRVDKATFIELTTPEAR